jgi:hypothetical protein
MICELEDDDNIYNDEDKIISMNKEEFKKYLNLIDVKFLDKYEENTTKKNPYLFQVFIIICSNGKEQLYEWLKEFREYDNFKSLYAFEKCLVNFHIELYKKIILENEINCMNENNFLSNVLEDCIRIGNLNMVKWLYSLEQIKTNSNTLNFIIACENNKMEIATWLLNNCSSIDLTENDYYVISNSCLSGNTNLIIWLFTLCPNVLIDNIIDAMFYNSAKCNLEFTQWVYGLDTQNKIKEESFIENISGACCNNLLDKAKWLYEIKPEIYENMMFEKIFINSSDMNTCEWILKIKPKLNIRFCDDSPFVYGYSKKKYEFSKWLLSLDNSINVQVQNNIAIRYCLLHENLEEAYYLLNYDTSLDLTDNDHMIFKELVRCNKIGSINILTQLVPNTYQIKILNNMIYSYKITNGNLQKNIDLAFAFPDELCCICLENNVNVKTICSHLFCYPCLNMHYNKTKYCPMCRKYIKCCVSN